MKNILFLASFVIASFGMHAQKPTAENIEVAKIFSDHMVLQRSKPIFIFGKATPGGTLLVSLGEDKVKARVGKKGNWVAELPGREEGGPMQLEINGKNQQIIYNDILIGEVWFCSGQSNMEWSVARAKNSEQEIENANFPKIRLFNVPNEMSVAPKQNLSYGSWEVCSPVSVADFSAVAYYFGRKLHQDLGVPVGLINSTWSGSEIEAWISLENISKIEAFESEYGELLKYSPEEVLQKKDQLFQTWYDQIKQMDEGYADNDFIWSKENVNDSDWEKVELPAPVEEIFEKKYDGITWLRKKIQLTASDLQSDSLYLQLGSIDDSDITFVNGQQVGKTLNDYTRLRKYSVASGVFHTGENTITVRIEDTQGGGGMMSDPDKLKLTTAERSIALSGEWKAKIGTESLPPMAESVLGTKSPNKLVTSLYNGMVAPVIPFAIRGVIWYQGESNTGSFDRAAQYHELFPLMIMDWRKHWGQGNFPFLFVHLANFLAPDTVPKDDPWPYGREAQLAALNLPNVAMASAIDIGERNSIHPKNKQDVGKRLALGALKLAYNKDIVYMGPFFESMTLHGDTAVLTFSHTGDGLKVNNKYGYLMGFAVAGNDSVYHYAQAKITGHNQVKVWSDNVSRITAVRYGWANNPEMANLYNSAGLPATPFRTDKWEPKQ